MKISIYTKQFLGIAILFLFIHAACDSKQKHNVSLDSSTIKDIDTLLFKCNELGGVDYKVAEMYAHQALKLSLSKTYKRGVGNSYYMLGRLAFYDDDYLKASMLYDSAFFFLEQTNSLKDISKLYYSIAETSGYMNSFEKAMEYCHKAINLNEKLQNKFDMAVCYNLLGNLHQQLGNKNKVMECFSFSLQMAEEVDAKICCANAYSSIGKYYENENQLDSALHYFQLALDLRMKSGSLRRIASSKQHLGNLYITLEKHEEAIKLLTDALEIYSNINEKFGMALIHNSLADLYFSLENYTKTIQHLNKSMSIAQQINSDMLLNKGYNLKSELLVKTGNIDSAFIVLQKSFDLYKNTFSKEKERIIKEMEYSFDAANKEKEIEILAKNNKINKQKLLILTFAIAALFLLIFTAAYLYYSKNKALKQKSLLLQNEKQISKQKIELKEKEKTILEKELQEKNKELAAKALSLMQNNETLQELNRKLEGLEDYMKPDNKSKLHEVMKEVEFHSKSSLWKEFDEAFQNVNNEFNEKLLEACPDLSASEIKIATLLRLNLSTKEIAAITFKSESGIKTARHRLRKKLNLDADENLVTYLLRL